MLRRWSKLVGGSALAGAVVIGAPLVAPASAAAPGVAYGGVTPQDFPVVIELNKSRKQVVDASIGLSLTCTSGGLLNLPDGYRKLKIKKGKFGASFGPTPVSNPDGTTTDIQGSISGKLNASATKISGKWQLKVTNHDAAGTVTDTCDSGSVSWKAKQ